MSLDIPKELSVAGYDNIPLAQQIYPSLTTVNQPLSTMAERAALLLIEGLKSDGAGPGPTMIKGDIVVRESTGQAPYWARTR